jgi:hypothetical protein
MSKFPADAPLRRVVKAFERLGFQLGRESNHIATETASQNGTAPHQR